MMEQVEIIKYKGYEIGVFSDDDGESPRAWDNLGHMICWHSRYDLGDEHNFSAENFERELACQVDETAEAHIEYWERGNGWKMLENKYGTDDYSKKACEMSEGYVQAIIEKALDKVIILPLYLYDHSGITMNTGGFSCPWDSGQVGFIYITYEEIKKEYSVKHISKATHKRVREYLIGEVEQYDMYLRGDVYGYMIRKPDGEWTGGCWGFYGDYNDKTNDMIAQAKGEVDWEIEQSQKPKQKAVA